ncbi:hypothetical protein ABW06_22720 [Pluralibacter gergoviae]|uniref:Prophage protein n=1 Tax=Pluralibacter gergoviae TaxID=61647 RepID=A0A0J5KX47_PLUGE|nr:hypothetical protein [Pluralibacter gergoviae]KMK11130.1 hypothetical protein ABW06_22720 [Pluralibacter gergoviae]
MNLTLTDKAEIKRIIAGLGDADMEHVHAETERLAASCAPLFDMLESHKPDEFTRDAVNWLREDDCNAQDEAATLFYDAILMRVKAEYAINVLMGRQRMEDAA